MNQMKDALKFLTDQAVAAHTAVIKPPAEPEHVYYIRELDGTLHKREAGTAPRSYHASSLMDLAQLYGYLAGNGGTEDGDEVHAIAFVGDDWVQIVLDERGDRRERLFSRLTLTKAVKTLRGLAKSGAEGLSQEELIQLLRVDLCGCVDKGTIQLFRTLKNTKLGTGEAKIETSSRGMSKSVLIEASAGGAEVPDELLVNVAIYEEFAAPGYVRPGSEVAANRGEKFTAVAPKRYPIRCAVVMNLDEFTFQVIPMAGELEQAYLAEQQRIAEELRFLVEKHNCTVVCGAASCRPRE